MRQTLAAARDKLWVAVPLAFSAAVYLPIVHNYFHADDFFNFYRMINDGFLAYLLFPQGGHLLLTRNALFWLSHAVFGLEPSYYLTVALLTHLLNVFLLFRVVRVFSGSDRLACFGATLWGISPVHEGALGWYSVYGQVLATTAFLLFLLDLGRHAAAGLEPSPRARLYWYALALVCCTSFGIGIALAPAFPFVALLLLPRTPGRPRRPPLLSLVVVVPVLVGAVHALHAVVSGEPPNTQRLWDVYVHLGWGVWTMLRELLSYGPIHLFFPFVCEAGGCPDIVPPLVAGVFVLLAASTLALRTGAVRRQLLAFLFVTLVSYFAVAVARGPFYLFYGGAGGTVARYHYGAFVGLILVACVILKELAAALRIARGARVDGLVTCLVVLLAAWLTSAHRIEHYENDARIVADTLAVIRSQVARCKGCADVYVENRRVGGLLPVHPPAVFPGRAALFVIFHPDNTLDGTRVRFLEKDRLVLEAARRGRRTRDLLVFQ
jgi:hypothetical protein